MWVAWNMRKRRKNKNVITPFTRNKDYNIMYFKKILTPIFLQFCLKTVREKKNTAATAKKVVNWMFKLSDWHEMHFFLNFMKRIMFI